MLLLLYTDEEGELPRPGVPKETNSVRRYLKGILQEYCPHTHI